MNDHSKRFQTIVEQVYESSLNNMEKTAYDWLISRGWDGKDIEEARWLSKGYEIVRYPDFSCEVRRIAKNATEVAKQNALCCLHCPLHVDCGKTHCPYDGLETVAMMSDGIGHIRTSRPLKEVIKDSEEMTKRLIGESRC